ncbi:hypothetical protein Dsin_001057 [Dipteronia sinensis]|uniref:Uncharacterized protein n=1 Tax=Dipteronia sinensis TaxID=43782 RepID=A0AAE0EI30_9ROSI|nr:hypothetical protein Dsin_001057 [Dipteronia sinensis]
MEVITGSCMKRKLEFLYAGDSEASKTAMLKKRFSETIFKAQQYKLNNKEIDSVQKTSRVPAERPEKCCCEGYAARVGADMKIDVKTERLRGEEKTSEEKVRFETLKRQQQRDGERANAKIKLQKMENSAGIEVNLESFRQLESLSGCTLSFVRLQNQVASVAFQGIRFWNPLDKFGLKIRDDDTILETFQAISFTTSVDGLEIHTSIDLVYPNEIRVYKLTPLIALTDLALQLGSHSSRLPSFMNMPVGMSFSRLT